MSTIKYYTSLYTAQRSSYKFGVYKNNLIMFYEIG